MRADGCWAVSSSDRKPWTGNGAHAHDRPRQHLRHWLNNVRKVAQGVTATPRTGYKPAPSGGWTANNHGPAGYTFTAVLETVDWHCRRHAGSLDRGPGRLHRPRWIRLARGRAGAKSHPRAIARAPTCRYRFVISAPVRVSWTPVS